MMAVYDTMRFVAPDVATICVGQAASASAILLAAGAPGKRAVLEHARVLLQQPDTEGRRGSMSDLALEAAELTRVRTQAELVLARHTGRTVDQLRADTDRALVLAGRAAVDYGIADRVPEPAPSGRGELQARTALRPGACRRSTHRSSTSTNGISRASQTASSRSEEISLRPCSTSDKYANDTAAVRATSASVRSCSRRSSRSTPPISGRSPDSRSAGGGAIDGNASTSASPRPGLSRRSCSSFDTPRRYNERGLDRAVRARRTDDQEPLSRERIGQLATLRSSRAP